MERQSQVRAFFETYYSVPFIQEKEGQWLGTMYGGIQIRLSELSNADVYRYRVDISFDRDHPLFEDMMRVFGWSDKTGDNMGALYKALIKSDVPLPVAASIRRQS